MQFTFHYGPIQIVTMYKNNDTNIAFTFHYGPIQIGSRLALLVSVNHLHSTMVLFKSSLTRKRGTLTMIYIPLWSYSNPYPLLFIFIAVIFTFHYGPIQIILIVLFCPKKDNLHSTMVLFKSKKSE